jgi:hypothetical protein
MHFEPRFAGDRSSNAVRQKIRGGINISLLTFFGSAQDDGGVGKSGLVEKFANGSRAHPRSFSRTAALECSVYISNYGSIRRRTWEMAGSYPGFDI